MKWLPVLVPTPRVSLWLALLLAVSAQARINVDSVPGRDSTQLTIYNSVDLTMVRETRYLTFRKGLNHLEFSWANTLIDPTSVEFKALTRADQIEVLDTSFPPRAPNTLEWRINSEFNGEVKVEIRYFTSGISWSADYVFAANPEEKLAVLSAFVKVNNQSGEDYENAQIRLVVGEIKLVEEIARLARGEKEGAVDRLAETRAAGRGGMVRSRLNRALAAGISEREEAKAITKEELSEYFLYTVEGRDTLPTGWSKRLPSFAANDVPFGSFYKFEKERWGGNVMRYYRFKNDKASKLGAEPLPNGLVKAFRVTGGDNLFDFAGETAVKYIPVNEFVEMELGRDQEVLVKPVLTDWRKEDIRFDKNGKVAGWTVVEEWRIEIQNSKSIGVAVDIRRHFAGDWSLTTADQFEKVDARTVKFLVPLKAREKKVIEYKVETRHGINALR